MRGPLHLLALRPRRERVRVAVLDERKLWLAMEIQSLTIVTFAPRVRRQCARSVARSELDQHRAVL
eukprot:786108-Prymnesium_polylepis.2